MLRLLQRVVDSIYRPPRIVIVMLIHGSKRLLRLVVICAFGATFGWLTSAANDGLGGGLSAYISNVIGTSWGWLAAGLAAVWPSRSWREGISRGMSFYVPAVCVYYISDLTKGVYDTFIFDPQSLGSSFGDPYIDFGAAVMDIMVYLVISGVVSAGLSVLSAIQRRGGLMAILAVAAVPAFVALDAFRSYQILLRSPVTSEAVTLATTKFFSIIGLIGTGIALGYGIVQHIRRAQDATFLGSKTELE